MNAKFAVPFIFAFLLLSEPAWAIGIGPGRIEADFQPGAEYDYSFQVLNNEKRTIDVELYVSGDLAKYITLSENSTTLLPGEAKIFNFHIKMPEELEPGKHDTRIGAVEAVSPEAPLAARAGVELQFWVHVPYPEKYIAVDIIYSQPEINQTMEFNVTLSNPVKVNLTPSADMEILKDDIVLERFDFGEVFLPSGSSHTFRTNWTATEEGAYKAIARAYYEGETTRKEVMFSIEAPRAEPQQPAPQKVEEKGSALYSPYALLIILIIIAIVIVILWPEGKKAK